MFEYKFLGTGTRLKACIGCVVILLSYLSGVAMSQKPKQNGTPVVRLIVLDPGHFHAALLQKRMNENIDSVVHVFAPDGREVRMYQKLIDEYNSRAISPTNWKLVLYLGDDFYEKMLETKPGNVVIIAGNNRLKTEYIQGAVHAGLNVLADKPLAINGEDFETLKEIFQAAQNNNVLVYDIMTERYSILNILQKKLSHSTDIFGELVSGTKEDPAVVSKSIHYFYKEVSGSPVVRPAWYFDVEQEGEGIVDVTTHLIDLIQWSCFPKEKIDYQKDISILTARRWPTTISLTEFEKVTQIAKFPEFLLKDIQNENLHVYANGEINYKLRGVHAQVLVEWRYEAPVGSGDSFYSLRRGTKANLIIRQQKEQGFKPVLYIEPVSQAQHIALKRTIHKSFKEIQKIYPGLILRETTAGWEVFVPERYKKGHEEHFADVVNQYVEYLKKGEMPEWEISSMISKYYTTTRALQVASKK